MEKLTALCCLWISGFCEKADYERELDKQFLENPESDLLLELEGLSGDKQGTLSMLTACINDENEDEFGRELFARVELYYAVTDIMRLKQLADRLWSVICAVVPFESRCSEPYYYFDYASELLDPDWGDEQRAREYYQTVFDHFKEKL